MSPASSRRIRLLALLFPWFAMRRIRLLTEQEVGQVGRDPWEAGYFRALWDVRVNLGLVEPDPNPQPTEDFS